MNCVNVNVKVCANVHSGPSTKAERLSGVRHSRRSLTSHQLAIKLNEQTAVATSDRHTDFT